MGALKDNPYLGQSALGAASGLLGLASDWQALNDQRAAAGNVEIPTEVGVDADFEPLKDKNLVTTGPDGKPSFSGLAGRYTEITNFDPEARAKQARMQYEAMNPQIMDAKQGGGIQANTKGLVAKSALSMAGKAAGTGAAIGAMFGGIGAPIGAGIGFLAGGIAGIFKGKKTKKQIEQRTAEANARLANAGEGFDQKALTEKLQRQQSDALSRFSNMQSSFNRQLGQYDAVQDQQDTNAALLAERRRKYSNIGRY